MCVATGALKTAILDGDIGAVRGVLDIHPQYVDCKIDPHYPWYPHQVAVANHQLEIAVCLEDEYNCMRKHNQDPRAESTKMIAENVRIQKEKQEEWKRKQAAGLMGPPCDAPPHTLLFIEEVEKEISRQEETEHARIMDLDLWCEYFYGGDKSINCQHFKDAMELLKHLKVLLTGTKEYVYFWKLFVETKDMDIMAYATDEVMQVCSAYNALVGCCALAVPMQMLP